MFLLILVATLGYEFECEMLTAHCVSRIPGFFFNFLVCLLIT